MTSRSLDSLSRLVLRDLRVGQSTADSMAPRIKVSTAIAETVCKSLAEQDLVELIKIKEVLDVYRITKRGLEIIA